MGPQPARANVAGSGTVLPKSTESRTRETAPVGSRPLALMNLERPRPSGNQVLVRVNACGLCRTDLHVVEGGLPPRRSPVIPGHQAVGVVEENGPDARRFAVGARVGIPWLHRTCCVR